MEMDKLLEWLVKCESIVLSTLLTFIIVMQCLFPGWQTRWFVLDNGILSYYKSQEEVNQGCKGSVKVSVCQINGKI